MHGPPRQLEHSHKSPPPYTQIALSAGHPSPSGGVCIGQISGGGGSHVTTMLVQTPPLQVECERQDGRGSFP
jgi:hypothetical protein